MKKEIYLKAAARTAQAFEKAGIIVTEEEKNRIEVADFGLNDLENIGLQILTYINTQRVCAKEMVLFPRQTCPEHRHVASLSAQGKEETFRCRSGKVYLYVSGERNCGDIELPPTKVTVFHQIILNAGEQYTIYPNTLHWFRAGDDGAVVSEFSTRSTDETDEFTDTRIVRAPSVEE